MAEEKKTQPVMTSQDQNNTNLGSMISGKTWGVKNIEAAYSRAGASNNHTPGVATKLGSQEQTWTSEHQGVGSAKFKESISDQRNEVSSCSREQANMADDGVAFRGGKGLQQSHKWDGQHEVRRGMTLGIGESFAILVWYGLALVT